MNTKSVATTFLSRNVELVGIIEKPDNGTNRGVIVVVGGPQYRIGSHRQFVLLTRYLTKNGISTMRFDHQGVGDSDGDIVGFENIGPNISSAVDCFFQRVPELSDVVLWGLCDAASAAMINAYQDQRVSGLILANPWVRTESGLAKVYLEKYYIGKLKSPEFWKSLIRGEVNVLRSILSIFRNLRSASSGSVAKGGDDSNNDGENSDESFINDMRNGLSKFSGNVLLILSENDLTAQEFWSLVEKDDRWFGLIQGDRFRITRIPDADHTFSSQASREAVEEHSRTWLESW